VKQTENSIVLVIRKDDDWHEAFPEFEDHEAVFEKQPHSGRPWGCDYYRSISDAAAVVLIGGGEFTFTTGMLALTSEIPLIACSHYGGAANSIWDELRAGQGLAESEDVSQVNEPGSYDMAEAC
jgi:hypothetical protein